MSGTARRCRGEGLMLSYTIDGQIVTIVATGATTTPDRRAFYAGIQADPRVPTRALLLIDGSRADPAVKLQELEDRAHLIAAVLGPKMGPVCAVIAPPRLTNDAEHFQAAGGQMGLRVSIFSDELSARRWLSEFARQ